MKNKTKNEIEQFVTQFCWWNLPGDKTWSNNFYECALGGYEIAQEEFKKQLKDKFNHLNSNLKQVNNFKLDKTVNQEARIQLEAQVNLLKELMNVTA